MPRIALPPALGESFAVADARAHGVGEGRLRALDLKRPFHGARTRPWLPDTGVAVRSGAGVERAEAERADVMRRIRAYWPLMPDDAFFVGPTAAVVLGIALPAGLHDDLHVGTMHPRSAPRRAGIRGVQVLERMVRIISCNGYRVSSPASTWAMLGAALRPYDLVAAADAVLRIPRHPGGFRPPAGAALASREQLTAALDVGRRRGAPALRAALHRARTGASSRPESWLRLVIVDGGLPEPDLDQDIVDHHGAFLGCSELVYHRERVAVEYESDRHLTRAQLERDIDKYESYAAVGFRTVRLTSHHVFTSPTESVRRVSQALAAHS